ncbi:MAG: universal stress protein [Bacteroidota bacterium]|nr:universal stress protein [Bacteroidota bacterium]MDP4232477.1 universal stress protein [Bacteroidota bacterium]MDP4241612.1 universal stress protein [Bacteroidota bacterium]MDP4286357.1 universal stress protein [Bacteroidota bacterium]
MRILIPWEGAPNPDLLVKDLHYAGLPKHAHALLLTPHAHHVAIPSRAFVASNHEYTLEDSLDEQVLSEAQRSKCTLSRAFPDWLIETEVNDRSSMNAAESISDRAHAWNADLIVIGSERRRSFFLTAKSESISAHIADVAPCSVRIVYPQHQHPDAPLQLLLFIDGSPESLLMMEEFAARPFPRNTCVHLISVVNELEWNIERVHHMLDYFAEHIRKNFPHIESQIRYGDIAEQILRYARQQEIDAIFIAADDSLENSHQHAVNVAALDIVQRAETTVEIVRRRQADYHERRTR